MNCKFCTTAKAVEFKRNLTTSEIIEQILLSKRILSENNQKLSNVVFMGMGEPFENYTNVLKSCFILSSDFGLGLGGNRITISTCGIIPGIYKLADCPSRYELAVSLNAPCEKIRTQIMPITKKYKFDELIKSLKYYNQKKPKNYITLEYVMLKNITDTEQCLNDLVKLCKKLKCKINLIRFNPTEFVNMKPSSKERMEFFFEFLNKNKIRTFTRKSKGKNISGACGQLAGKNKFNKE
jgi:23S rRNA (adenine2503-C2)-methyltransferase